MDAAFSGQAGTLAFIEGSEVRLRRISDLDKEIPIRREEAGYLFQGCNDVVVLKGVRPETAQAKFVAAWESDRALRMLLLTLDPEEDPSVRVEAADWLEVLLDKGDAKLFVENELYSRPLPKDTDFEFITNTQKWPKTKSLLAEIISRL